MVEDGANLATSIVKVACLFLIGVILINGVGTAVSGDGGYTTIWMIDNPADGDTLTLGGTNLMVFEFNNTGTVEEGHWAVEINNTSAATTFTNLLASLEANTNYGLVLVDAETITVDGEDANAVSSTTEIEITETQGTGMALYTTITSSISSGYALATLMILVMGAVGIMRFLGYM